MNRSESRYFATAARMDEAFLTLLAKKDFEYITIKEIYERAISCFYGERFGCLFYKAAELPEG